MAKDFEPNQDWITRENGRIPSKGAKAAERASAGLGATDNSPVDVVQVQPRAPKQPEPSPKLTA